MPYAALAARCAPWTLRREKKKVLHARNLPLMHPPSSWTEHVLFLELRFSFLLEVGTHEHCYPEMQDELLCCNRCCLQMGGHRVEVLWYEASQSFSFERHPPLFRGFKYPSFWCSSHANANRSATRPGTAPHPTVRQWPSRHGTEEKRAMWRCKWDSWGGMLKKKLLLPNQRSTSSSAWTSGGHSSARGGIVANLLGSSKWPLWGVEMGTSEWM